MPLHVWPATAPDAVGAPVVRFVTGAIPASVRALGRRVEHAAVSVIARDQAAVCKPKSGDLVICCAQIPPIRHAAQDSSGPCTAALVLTGTHILCTSATVRVF